jgi:hypothetical protein
VNPPPADVPYHRVVGKDIIGDKKNRPNLGSPQAFDYSVQNGLTQQVEHGCGHAEKGWHRLRKTIQRGRRAYIIADTSTKYQNRAYLHWISTPVYQL